MDEEKIQKYEDTTPEELIGIGHQKLQDDLASELLDRIKDCSPSFFEKIVVSLWNRQPNLSNLPLFL